MTMAQLAAQKLGTTGLEITRIDLGAWARVDELLAAATLELSHEADEQQAAELRRMS